MSELGEIRLSQVILTYGPGAMVDFPQDSAIMGGLNHWPNGRRWRRWIEEPRLRAKLRHMTGQANVTLISPPCGDKRPGEEGPSVAAFRFPNWFIVRADLEDERPRRDGDSEGGRWRRLVQRSRLDKGLRYGEKHPTVPIRFIKACPMGHVEDIDWRELLPCAEKPCRKPLWLVEGGAGGELSDMSVHCTCGAKLELSQLKEGRESGQEGEPPLGWCGGGRPWLGRNQREHGCRQRPRLLIRTATNAYFPITISVLSIPEHEDPLQEILGECDDMVQGITSRELVAAFRNVPSFGNLIQSYSDDEVWDAIVERRNFLSGEPPSRDAELDAILKAPTEYLADLPRNQEFLARRLPRSMWDEKDEWPQVASVVQLHRLREVVALRGFTRFEAPTPDIHGEYDGDVQVAAIDVGEVTEFPAVENRGEGVFIELETEAVRAWSQRDGVKHRGEQLRAGHAQWVEKRDKKGVGAEYLGVTYTMLHTLSHLLIQSLSLASGYPATSIRERIYVDQDENHQVRRCGILLYTSTPDAEGTLGGLVGEARRMGRHLRLALRSGELCSNDPICAQHDPSSSLEERWLHGAACHACGLIAETSCERFNETLDRALVVPVLGTSTAAFFDSP